MEAAKAWGLPPWRIETDCPEYWWKRWLVVFHGGAALAPPIFATPPADDTSDDDPYAQSYWQRWQRGELPDSEYSASDPYALEKFVALTESE